MDWKEPNRRKWVGFFGAGVGGQGTLGVRLFYGYLKKYCKKYRKSEPFHWSVTYQLVQVCSLSLSEYTWYPTWIKLWSTNKAFSL